MLTKIEQKSVFKDLKRIGIPGARRIISQLEMILRENPDRYQTWSLNFVNKASK